MRGPKLQVMTSLTSCCNYFIKPSKWQNWREIILTVDNTNLSSHGHTPFEVNVTLYRTWESKQPCCWISLWWIYIETYVYMTQLENCHLNAIDLGSQYECTGSVWIPKIVKPDPPRATHLMGSRLQGERPDRCWQGQSRNSDFEHGGLPCGIPFAVYIDFGHLPGH